MESFFRNFSRLGKPDLKFFIFYMISFEIIAALYNFTLQGGDVKFLVDRLALFGITMIFVSISSICITIIAISKYSQVKIPTKIVSLGLG